MKIEILTSGDNYIYLIRSGNVAGVVDPGSAGPVRRAVELAGITLDAIFVTHNHADHTGGCSELESAFGCRVFGPGRACPVGAGDVVSAGSSELVVMSVPGHTSNDVAYYSETAGAVFTGDTLFAGGCGRLFGGTAEQMWDSLKKLRELPDDTLVYCGHDYTVDNLEFALDIEPGNAAVEKRLSEERRKRSEDRTPSSIKLEKVTNPFLRCDDDAFKLVLGLAGRSAVEVFTEIRTRKNSW